MSVADIVHTWFRERLATGEIARNTGAYNQAVSALPDLIARLDPPPPAPTAAPEAPTETTIEAAGEKPPAA